MALHPPFKLVHGHTVRALARARGSLLAEEPGADGEGLRVPAWNEDGLTLALEAAQAIVQSQHDALPDHVMVMGTAPSEVWQAAPAVVAGAFGFGTDAVQVKPDADRAPSAVPGTVLVLVLFDPQLGPGARSPAEATGAAALVDLERPGVLDAAELLRLAAGQADVSGSPRRVSVETALHQVVGRQTSVPEVEVPMGAYVPLGTWDGELDARLGLEAQRCASCTQVRYPPRGSCPQCGDASGEIVQLPPEACIYAATRIGPGGAPSEYAREQEAVGTYGVGLVEWPSLGVRIIARLEGPPAEMCPPIGTPCTAVIRRLFRQEGRVRYGTWFRVASGP